MRTPREHTVDWEVVRAVPETDTTTTLFLRAHDVRPDFIAGQYLTVMLPGHSPVEGKSYSISSTPAEETVALTVKRMGAFSTALALHRVGDTLTTSLPYGFFYPEPPYQDVLVFIAGGIGITPIVSIIETLLTGGHDDPIMLVYSNRTEADTVFSSRIAELAATHPNFTLRAHLTRETPRTPHTKHGRITAADILPDTADAASCDFFICGSIGFTRDMWRLLIENGVPRARVYTEGFY